MSQQYNKLNTLLKELFQLDQPDLDFGFYRIMHAKAQEISTFLDKDLLPQIQAAFGEYADLDKAKLQRELDGKIQQIKSLGSDPEQSTLVLQLREQLQHATDVRQLEAETYDHLYSFFRRYYSEGDYLSKRVYKQGVYAIPYEGEEVKLHWANSDQYYIKSSEYLRDYAFRLRPDDSQKPMRVHFRLVDAAEGEHGNVKAIEGKERVFILAAGQFIHEDQGELIISFAYRPATISDFRESPPSSVKGGQESSPPFEKGGQGGFNETITPNSGKSPLTPLLQRGGHTNPTPHLPKGGHTKPPTQKELIALTVERILSVNEAGLSPWINELAQAHCKVDGEQADYTRLEAHLRRYTARNTFDYFIHKDLGGFLRRELDFYIKNEIMHLDDVENESFDRVKQYLSKIKILRRIAGKIISFLAQLEDFQKKLWLKKKFVIATEYCITLDRIPEDFYPEIAANDAQREEWVKLFAIDEIKGDLLSPSYTVPLTVEFLQANNKLLVDTGLFNKDLKTKLIASIEDFDTKLDGVLVHGDNYQALQLVQSRYLEQVKCIYIDPPYNTASSSIPYKNNYRHSAFATMMHDRIASLQPLLRRDGVLFVSIDKTERTILEYIMDGVFGSDNHIEELIWAMNTNNGQSPNYSTNHEYILVYAKDRITAELDRNMFREPKPGYEEVMALVAELNPIFPTITEIENKLRALYERHQIAYREEVEALGREFEDEKSNDPWKGLYAYTHAEYRNESGEFVPEIEAKNKQAMIWIWQEGDASMPATKQAASTRDDKHRNWRFYRPHHPITGGLCPHPKSGWKFAYDDDEDSPDKRSFVSLDRDHRIAWGPTEVKVPRLKRMLHEVETNVGKSVFADYSDGEKQTSALFGRSGIFLAPKHADFVSRFIQHSASREGIILDCFGGSGSTAHAVIKLNREDHGKRKYVTVEINDYFDTVLKPRVLKAVYSHDWRAGKPLSRQGISQCIKIIRLESYEDTLNNLELHRSVPQQSLFDLPEAQGADGFKEEYLLRYMLDVETQGSQSLLNIQAFADPTAYQLKVKRPGSDESRLTTVDLLETFNYLIGLTVRHIAAPQMFTAEFVRDGEGRLQLQNGLHPSHGGNAVESNRHSGMDRRNPDCMDASKPRHPWSLGSGGPCRNDEENLNACKNGPWWFRTVTGSLPDGTDTLIVWRKLTGDAEQDNRVLDAWFVAQGHAEPGRPFGLVYVNGDNTLENLKPEGEVWKVRLIEEDFHRLMFDNEGR